MMLDITNKALKTYFILLWSIFLKTNFIRLFYVNSIFFNFIMTYYILNQVSKILYMDSYLIIKLSLFKKAKS